MQFFEQLIEMARKQGGFVAIVEVCGFNDWLLEMLHEYGYRDVMVVQASRLMLWLIAKNVSHWYGLRFLDIA